MPFFLSEKRSCIFFLLFFILLAAHPAKGQRFRANLYAGLNLSQIDGDQLAGYNQPGIGGGIQTNVILNGRWEWSLGISYAQQGARKNSFSGNAALRNIRLNTIEVPLMIHFNEWKFQIGTGIAFNRLMSARVIDDTGADVRNLYDLRDNQFSGLVEARVFLKENTGFGLRWYKNLFNIQQERASGTWIGRTINLHGFLRL
jgi:hypothetical protein